MIEQVVISGFLNFPKALRNDLVREDKVVESLVLHDFPCTRPG